MRKYPWYDTCIQLEHVLSLDKEENSLPFGMRVMLIGKARIVLVLRAIS
jgi:hypothetical protein